jgi:cytochrome c peroxidase
LRNVAHISPYGHSCAYGTLEGVVRHQLDPIASLNAYLESAAVLSLTMGEDDFVAMRDADEVAKIAAANELESIDLNEKEIAEIIAFLNALTDPQSLKGALRIPSSALSGLPLDQ